MYRRILVPYTPKNNEVILFISVCVILVLQLFVMHTRRERYTQTAERHGYKKRGDRLLPVPRIEALRLPVVIRTSNHRPHADMNTILPTQRNMYIHTHGHLLLQCSRMTIWNFSGFYASRTKRKVNAFIIFEISLPAQPHQGFSPSARRGRLSSLRQQREILCKYSDIKLPYKHLWQKIKGRHDDWIGRTWKRPARSQKTSHVKSGNYTREVEHLYTWSWASLHVNFSVFNHHNATRYVCRGYKNKEPQGFRLAVLYDIPFPKRWEWGED